MSIVRQFDSRLNTGMFPDILLKVSGGNGLGVTTRTVAALCCMLLAPPRSSLYGQVPAHQRPVSPKAGEEKRGAFSASITELEASVRLRPDIGEAWYELGQAYLTRAQQTDIPG